MYRKVVGRLYVGSIALKDKWIKYNSKKKTNTDMLYTSS